MNEQNDTVLDEQRDRMVAALYGELGEPELQTLHAAIAADAELQADWRELQAMRQLIQIAEEAPAAVAPAPATTPSHPIRRVLASFSSSRLAASGLGFAMAATLFMVLLIGGLRVDRTPNGLLVRLDGSIASDIAVASAFGSGDPDRTRPGVSQTEMAELAQALASVTAARLDLLERRQGESQAGMTRALYDALLINQQQQYVDLRNRIERVAYTAGTTSSTAYGAPAGRIIEGGILDDN